MTDSEDKDKESWWRDEVRHQTHDPIPGVSHHLTHAEVLKQTSTHAPTHAVSPCFWRRKRQHI
jgi:hypothetical protein